MDLGVRPEGHITIEVDGKPVREFSNIVLNGGWESLLSRMLDADGSMVPKWLYFGTGDSEPSADDPGLEQRITAGKNHTSIVYGGLTDVSKLIAYSEALVRFDYAPGELSGYRWAELGLAYDNEYAEPYNRALVLDENRIPVPLVVLPDQEVTVYVRLRLYATGWGSRVETGDVRGVLTMSPNISSPTVGLWRKGFPLQTALLGTLAAIREVYNPPSAKFLFVTGSTLSASTIFFRSRDNIGMLQIDLDNPSSLITNLTGLNLHFRIEITIVRGD